MTAQPFLFGYGWIEVRDGNDTGRALFDRHYSRYRYKDGRKPRLYVGPGEKMVLLTACARALFVWRKFRSGDLQSGVNCAIFRNEGAGLSSRLILAAMQLAWARWPFHRLYTYVNPKKIKSTNPGFCFQKAGWRKCGVTKVRKLIIFEFLPEWGQQVRAAA